jgi:putative hydrolase of the HAD superfamily
MPAISVILFDLNGVLYRYDQAARVARLAALTGRSPDAVRTAIWDSGFEDSGDAGTWDADAYQQGFANQLGYPLTEADWLAALQGAVAPIPATMALIPRLRAGVTRAVLTNNNLLVRRHFATLFPGIAQQIGHAFVSAEFGARKPDPEVYRQCVARLGATPAQVLFIDDSAANAHGAAQAGLATHHYTNSEDLETVLQAAGLLLP